MVKATVYPIAQLRGNGGLSRVGGMTRLRLLDLFSGIGGFSLGLERSGAFETVAFCEIEPFCRAVLKKHWPHVPCYDDVRSLTGKHLATDGIGIDAICGGFPCQDISLAGAGAGIEGERSGLWREYARIIGEIRPRYVIVENVAALLGRGLDRVLGDLASLGFDAEWHCIPASAVGAPHRRDRVWIVANAAWVQPEREVQWTERERIGASSEYVPMGNAHGPRLAFGEAHQDRQSLNASAPAERTGRNVPDANSQPTKRLTIAWSQYRHWLAEPDVGRVAHGIPSRVDRLRSLGNAVVPQIPELIGRAIAAQLEAA